MRLLRGVAITLLLLALSGGGLYGLSLMLHGGGNATATPEKPVATPVAARGLDTYQPMSRPMPLPPFAFVDDEGRSTDLSDFKGQVVLLNMWATWCGPCVKEMPSLDRLQGKLGGKDFQVVAISVDRGGRGVVEPFLQRLGVTRLAVYLDPESRSLRAMGLKGVPTSLLINRDGLVVGAVEGDAEWDAPDAVALIRRLIGRDPGVPDRRQGGIVKTGG